MRFSTPRAGAMTLALLVSTGCAMAEDPAVTPPPEPDETVCGASELQDIVGLKFDVSLLPGGAEPVRVIRPDMAVTMDYRAERLNVLLDDEDTITEVRCG